MPTEPVYALALELTPNSLTAISSLCERASFSRSINDAFTPFHADEAVFELSNDVGSMSPLINTGLIPGRKVQLTATYGGSAYALFTGRIKALSTRPVLGQTTTTLEALTDADRLSRTQISMGLRVGIKAESLFTEIMTRTAVASYSVDTLGDTIDFVGYSKRNAAGAIDELIRSGYYQAYVDGAGTYRLRGRYWAAFATAVDTVTAGFDFNYQLNDSGIINRASASAVPRQQSTTVTTLAYLAQPVTIPASSAVGFFVQFYDPRGGTAVPTAVGSSITPVSSVDYYAAANSDGTGTDFTSAVSLSIALFGAAAVASIFNTNSAAVFLTRFQVRGYPILEGAALTLDYESASSQALYGLREMDLGTNLISNFGFIADYVRTVVGERQEPRDKVTVQQVNEFPSALMREVGDVFSIVNSLTGVNSTWGVRSVRHELNLKNGLAHSVEYSLERFAARPWLVLDHATYGKLDSGRQLAL